MSTAIAIAGFGPRVAVSIDPEAHTKRDEIIATASMVTTVTNPSQQEFAVSTMREIKALCRQIETARVEIKAPVLTLGKDIDKAASVQRAHVAPARAEGMTVRKVWRYRVNDIRALAFSRPDLVRIEENKSAILEALKRGETITNVEAWQETEAGVRV